MSPEPCRRDRLKGLEAAESTHAGLWLDKYMDRILKAGEKLPKNDVDPKHTLVAEVAARNTPALYADFYKRWRATLSGLGAHVKEARAVGRIVLGMGNESVLETAITLHRTYGVPYLPGSALKGLAASYASQRLGDNWREGSSAYGTLFGDTKQAGYVTFFDAYPFAEQSQLLHTDIMAIHHPDYYQQGDKPPADWDDPSLVPFLSATGSYAVALAGDGRWVYAAFHILANALLDVGIGAKTSSGYGRMCLEGFEQLCRPVAGPAAVASVASSRAEGGEAVQRPTSQGKPPTPTGLRSRDEIRLDGILAKLKQLERRDMKQRLEGFYQQWATLDTSDAKRTLAAAILAKIEQARMQADFAGQPWYRELQRFVQAGGGA